MNETSAFGKISNVAKNLLNIYNKFTFTYDMALDRLSEAVFYFHTTALFSGCINRHYRSS